MRRIADFLLRNWPLKLGAIFLATILYSGLVLGQNVRTWEGTLNVDGLDPPTGATLLSALEPVKVVRYRAPLDIGVVSPALFRASADLSRIEVTAGGPPQEVAITLIALDNRIQVIDFQPQVVQVRLDPVASRTMAVTVDVGAVPDGLNLSLPQIDPSSVTLRGASSRVNQVASVVVRVPIDASALNIDRDFDLVPVDASGNEVPNLELDPERARVRIAVARELANRTLPLVPQIIGQPAQGYRISSVTVEPLTVTVSGEEATVTQLETATTEPIDVNGRTEDLEATIKVALPPGVSVSGDDTVRVLVTIDQETGSRTFHVAVRLVGDGTALSYQAASGDVQVTLAGPVGVLQAIDTTQLVATIDVTQLPDTTGQYSATVLFVPPSGLEVAAITPSEVIVSVVALAPSIPPTEPPSPSPAVDLTPVPSVAP